VLQDHFRSQLPIHKPQPSTLPLIASAICSFDGLDLISSLSSGSLRATIWKKSAKAS
jgi:hypothetical protein